MEVLIVVNVQEQIRASWKWWEKKKPTKTN